jgi:NAD(P)-dependent dehydrogenase (short-subunit alcohol dehydrogenase family)
MERDTLGVIIMDKKTILITGATDGLGKELAFQLAAMGVHLILHGRNQLKAENVKSEIIRITGNKNIDVIIADFKSLNQVKNMAQTIKRNYRDLNVLVNNAGVYLHKRQITPDGYEMTFAVNHLAPFLLTNVLLELLKTNAPSQVINVSSVGHKFVALHPAYLKGKHFFWDWVAYCRSKLLNILFTFELAERVKSKQIYVNAIHPGVLTTNLTKNAKVFWGISVKEGAASIVNLIMNPQLANITGKYFDKKRIGKSSSLARNVKIRKKVWQISTNLISTIL